MMKMRWVLLFGLFAVLCLSSPTTAEDPKAEPESAAEPEPAADEDAKHGASAGKQTKDAKGNNPAAAPWAFSVPTIFTIVCVAKFIL